MHPAHPVIVIIALLAVASVGSPAAAQQDSVQQRIRASEERLREIRAEREQLQREMETLRGRARDISADLSNIERQVNASAGALRELDFQTAALAASVDEITQQLIRTRDRLRERNVVLGRRMRVIYQQGPLHAARVLLSAEDFGDLLNRYKYLHLVSVHDRLLLREISGLERDLTLQEHEIKESLARIVLIRSEKLSEFAQLQYLEQARSRTLQDVRARATRTEGRIQEIAEDEKRLTGVLGELERVRLAEERRREAAGILSGAAGALTPRDLGNLPWPVEGPLLYRFGPERRPNGVTLRRNGIGISAEPGTTVQAVKEGTVVVAGPMEGFGRGVVLSHGAGFYTLYLYLRDVRVQEGQDVPAGHILGAVGSAADDGPHLFFRLHAPIQGQAPMAVDPLPWLRDP
ncbi:MAG TPA: peptidoglycan DD-metalloendopeptidase family protein [Longimicrobiales bacterium]|nr:peptidoglycan DD-metalloendopeptidase family protein [Longimicrobiales bacterium]